MEFDRLVNYGIVVLHSRTQAKALHDECRRNDVLYSYHEDVRGGSRVYVFILY